MAPTKRAHRRRPSKSRIRQNLQKPNGVIGPRVAQVGGDRFAIVCIDPAKERSEWMMADYFGKVLIPPQTLTHQAAYFKLAAAQIREAQQKHDIQDVIVVVERTGYLHHISKRAFMQAGFEVRVLHPFATKQYRMPADPGNKTDENDLYAQHRAAIAGFGLCEFELEPPYRELRLRARHRRKLVEMSSALACRIRDHLHLSMPGFASLFDHLLEHRSALALARRCQSPQQVLEIGHNGLCHYLRQQKVRHQVRTVEKVVAWASKAEADSIEDGPAHHAIWTDLHQLYDQLRKQIATIESELAADLIQTPYVRLLAIPGINVVLAADLASEMGPIHHYANANAITGRSGLYPSRYQSDQTDQSGPLVRQANRRLRCALMRIAESLAFHCAYYRGHAELDRTRGMAARASRVKIAKKFSRLAFACLTKDEPMKHPAFQKPDSIIEKLRKFFHVHETPIDQSLEHLQTAIKQLPYNTRDREAQIVSDLLQSNVKRRRGGKPMGLLLPAVLARLGVTEVDTTASHTRGTPTANIETRDRS